MFATCSRVVDRCSLCGYSPIAFVVEQFYLMLLAQFLSHFSKYPKANYSLVGVWVRWPTNPEFLLTKGLILLMEAEQ